MGMYTSSERTYAPTDLAMSAICSSVSLSSTQPTGLDALLMQMSFVLGLTRRFSFSTSGFQPRPSSSSQ